MNYFGRKTSIGRLQVDPNAIDSDCPAVQTRLNRISDNYLKLDQVLCDLESKISQNDYLKAKREQEEAERLLAEQERIAGQDGSVNSEGSSVAPKLPR